MGTLRAAPAGLLYFHLAPTLPHSGDARRRSPGVLLFLRISSPTRNFKTRASGLTGRLRVTMISEEKMFTR
jgi:hypothetical protein